MNAISVTCKEKMIIQCKKLCRRNLHLVLKNISFHALLFLVLLIFITAMRAKVFH